MKGEMMDAGLTRKANASAAMRDSMQFKAPIHHRPREMRPLDADELSYGERLTALMN
jgi:hypothetical protein